MKEKSKLSQIQSKIEVLNLHFGDENPKLKSELDDILNLIKQEQSLRTELSNTLSEVIGKI